ncbi:hypothetical protein KPH14_011331 [Odynerus spinipes]|uniref:Uncharacterized protein n=1 Tax=Odynerus spinipes TaxID=1348599 RepID=A0AAD9RK95_9HYME|nr:hypothetical protein KPH14_011331 [Odynerus spinipes]
MIVNIPNFLDGPDSLRRKRQKHNNNPNALVLRHVQTEAGKNDGLLNQPVQYNFNLLKLEPVEPGPLYGGSIASPGSLSLYSVDATSPQPNMQTLRPQVSPGRTPSPMEYNPYTPPLMQPQLSPQYQPSSSNMTQPPSVGLNVQQQYQFLQQNNPHGSEQLMLNQVTSEHDVANLLSIHNAGNLQYSFDLGLNQLDLAEIADFGTTLSENLSSGLSISESTKPETNEHANLEAHGMEESNNMTDSFTKLTNTTIQELRNLNNMYKTTTNNDS